MLDWDSGESQPKSGMPGDFFDKADPRQYRNRTPGKMRPWSHQLDLDQRQTLIRLSACKIIIIITIKAILVGKACFQTSPLQLHLQSIHLGKSWKLTSSAFLTWQTQPKQKLLVFEFLMLTNDLLPVTSPQGYLQWNQWCNGRFRCMYWTPHDRSNRRQHV